MTAPVRGAFGDAVEDVVARFRAAGIGRDDRVAVIADASAGAVAALAAIASIRAVAAPLSPRLTARELDVALALIAPRLVLGGEKLPALPERIPSLPPGVPGAVAVLTSGTTGRPKVALLSDAALEASARSWIAALPRATGWLLCLGLGHVAGLGVVRRASLAGVPLVVRASSDPASLLDALSTRVDGRGPSHVSLVPTQLARLIDVSGDGGAPEGLRAVLLGGGVIPPELVTRALAAGWPVVPTYGLTETASGATALPTPEAAVHPGTAGWPLPGIELRIAHADADGVGDILVRSPSLFSGYLGDPGATAEAFTRDGWLRTGDLGRLDDAGRLIVVDRRTDLIVSGGENVAPAEVEAVLVEHPAIADAGVVSRPDPTWGAVPVAAIVVREHAGSPRSGARAPGGDGPSDDELRAFCRERLAPYKVPASFVRVASLPRTPSGKLQRGRLRDRLLGSRPR